MGRTPRSSDGEQVSRHSGATREAAEQEAAKQIKAWDAEFSAIIATASAVARGEKRWLDPKAMKRLLSPEHRLRELAEQLTAQVQAELTALGFLLKFGALLKYTVQWGTCRPRL